MASVQQPSSQQSEVLQVPASEQMRLEESQPQESTIVNAKVEDRTTVECGVVDQDSDASNKIQQSHESHINIRDVMNLLRANDDSSWRYMNRLTKEEKGELFAMILRQPSEKDRSSAELQFLSAQCMQIAFFQNIHKNYGAHVVSNCLPLLKYLEHRAGETLFEQGERGTRFYIILEGIVEVLIRLPDKQNKDKFVSQQINQIGPGLAFGEVGLMNDNAKRSATIKTLTRCTFAYLEKADFNYVIRFEATQKINERYAFIKEYEFFDDFAYRELITFSYHFQEQHYKPGEIVYDAMDVKPDEVFFVKEGTFMMQAVFETVKYNVPNLKQKKKTNYFNIFPLMQRAIFGLELFNQPLIQSIQDELRQIDNTKQLSHTSKFGMSATQEQNQPFRIGRVVCDQTKGILYRVKASELEKRLWREESRDKFSRFQRMAFDKQADRMKNLTMKFMQDRARKDLEEEQAKFLKPSVEYLGKSAVFTNNAKTPPELRSTEPSPRCSQSQNVKAAVSSRPSQLLTAEQRKTSLLLLNFENLLRRNSLQQLNPQGQQHPQQQLIPSDFMAQLQSLSPHRTIDSLSPLPLLNSRQSRVIASAHLAMSSLQQRTIENDVFDDDNDDDALSQLSHEKPKKSYQSLSHSAAKPHHPARVLKKLKQCNPPYSTSSAQDVREEKEFRKSLHKEVSLNLHRFQGTTPSPIKSSAKKNGLFSHDTTITSQFTATLAHKQFQQNIPDTVISSSSDSESADSSHQSQSYQQFQQILQKQYTSHQDDDDDNDGEDDSILQQIITNNSPPSKGNTIDFQSYQPDIITDTIMEENPHSSSPQEQDTHRDDSIADSSKVEQQPQQQQQQQEEFEENIPFSPSISCSSPVASHMISSQIVAPTSNTIQPSLNSSRKVDFKTIFLSRASRQFQLHQLQLSQQTPQTVEPQVPRASAKEIIDEAFYFCKSRNRKIAHDREMTELKRSFMVGSSNNTSGGSGGKEQIASNSSKKQRKQASTSLTLRGIGDPSCETDEDLSIATSLEEYKRLKFERKLKSDQSTKFDKLFSIDIVELARVSENSMYNSAVQELYEKNRRQNQEIFDATACIVKEQEASYRQIREYFNKLNHTDRFFQDFFLPKQPFSSAANTAASGNGNITSLQQSVIERTKKVRASVSSSSRQQQPRSSAVSHSRNSLSQSNNTHQQSAFMDLHRLTTTLTNANDKKKKKIVTCRLNLNERKTSSHEEKEHDQQQQLTASSIKQNSDMKMNTENVHELDPTVGTPQITTTAKPPRKINQNNRPSIITTASPQSIQTGLMQNTMITASYDRDSFYRMYGSSEQSLSSNQKTINHNTKNEAKDQTITISTITTQTTQRPMSGIQNSRSPASRTQQRPMTAQLLRNNTYSPASANKSQSSSQTIPVIDQCIDVQPPCSKGFLNLASRQVKTSSSIRDKKTGSVWSW